MSNDTQDGDAPAFSQLSTPHPKGVTVRDYFAAKALQGEIARTGMEAGNATKISLWAYEYADAMLWARARARARAL